MLFPYIFIYEIEFTFICLFSTFFSVIFSIIILYILIEVYGLLYSDFTLIFGLRKALLRFFRLIMSLKRLLSARLRTLTRRLNYFGPRGIRSGES